MGWQNLIEVSEKDTIITQLKEELSKKQLGAILIASRCQPFGGSPSHGATPMDGLCHRKSSIKMDDEMGYPYFRKPPFVWVDKPHSYRYMIATHYAIFFWEISSDDTSDKLLCHYNLSLRGVERSPVERNRIVWISARILGNM